jgi:hypothetical protein
MFDMNLVATMAMAVGLVGGAALALWQLPWSEAELRAANADLKASVPRPAAVQADSRRALRYAFR